MAWRQASIVGVGATRQGKLPDETPLSLAAQAFCLALEDCGIDKAEVDGLLTMPGTTSPEGARIISMWESSSVLIRASPAV